MAEVEPDSDVLGTGLGCWASFSLTQISDDEDTGAFSCGSGKSAVIDVAGRAALRGGGNDVGNE